MAAYESRDPDLSAPAVHQIGSDNGLDVVVSALDQQIRTSLADQRRRRIIVEGGDQIDGGEARQNQRPRFQAVHRPALALGPAYGVVGIDRHDQAIAPAARLGEIGDMSWMKDVEAAVGETDLQAAFPPEGDLTH